MAASCDAALRPARGQFVPKAFEFFWPFGFELKWFAGGGVVELQGDGVQSQTWGADLCCHRAVLHVAADGMAELGKMDADLIRATGLQLAFKQRVAAARCERLDVSDRELTFILE